MEQVSQECEAGWTDRVGLVTLHTLLENYRVTPHNTVIAGTRQVRTTRGPVRNRLPDRAVVADLTRALHDRFPALSPA